MSTPESVLMFGNYDGDYKSVKVSSDGKLAVDATLSVGGGISTAAKQDDMISKLPTGLTTAGNLKVSIEEGGTAGGATEAKQDTLISKLPTGLTGSGNLKVAIEEGAISGFATSSKQDTLIGRLPTGLTGSGNLKVCIQELGNEGSERLNTQMESDQLPTALTGSGNMKVSIQELDTSGTGIATSALQTAGNSSLATIATETASMDGKITACNTGAVVVSSSALPTGSSTSAKQDDILTKLTTLSGQLPTSLTNGRLNIENDRSPGNGGDEIYSNATISSANTFGTTEIPILEDKKLMIIGNTSTSSARIGLAFSDTQSPAVYHPGPQYADLYYDGSKYCFAMTITDILTDNAKIYFQTPASNVNLWVFTY